MSPSRSSGVGLFFPGLEGGRGGGRGGLLAGSAPGRGLGMGQGRETQEGELKSHFSDLINGEFVYECGKIEREGRVRKKGCATWCFMKRESILRSLICAYCN